MQVRNSVLSLQAPGVDDNLPVQCSWESFADDFESFLEANFQEDKMQPVAQEQPITVVFHLPSAPCGRAKWMLCPFHARGH